MTKLFGYKGSYAKQQNFDGQSVASTVSEYLMVTEHSLVHFKMVRYARSTRLFVDIDSNFDIKGLPKSNQMAKLARHEQFKRAHRNCAMNDSTFLPLCVESIDDLERSPDHALLMNELRKGSNPKASNAYRLMCGLNNADDMNLGDILKIAIATSEIQRETRQQSMVAEMAINDELWGIF